MAVGREPGIYTEWTEAQKAFVGWKGVKQRSFKTRGEAVEYIKLHGSEAGQKAIENEVAEPPAKKAKASKASKTNKTNKTAEENILDIYTDGSSRGNGKVGATAGVGVFFGENDKRFVPTGVQTRRSTPLTHIVGTFPSALRETRRPTSVLN